LPFPEAFALGVEAALLGAFLLEGTEDAFGLGVVLAFGTVGPLLFKTCLRKARTWQINASMEGVGPTL